MTEVECVWDAKAILGEGTLWHEDSQSLYWLDIKSSRLMRYEPELADKTIWQLDEALTCMAPRAKGGFVGTFQSFVAFLDGHGAVEQEIARPETHLPDNRFNDGKAGPDGALWFGSMDNIEKSPTGSLYRLGPDLKVEKFSNSSIVTNGPAMGADGKTLYFTDTFERTIFAFDLNADGTLSNKRVHITLSEDDGYPDGMTVDADGFLWVCTFFGWKVIRFDPNGIREREIRLPVSNVTCCAFGGANFDTLYISTARWALSDEAAAKQPLAGGLFRCEPGVRGLPSHRFNG